MLPDDAKRLDCKSIRRSDVREAAQNQGVAIREGIILQYDQRVRSGELRRGELAPFNKM